MRDDDYQKAVAKFKQGLTSVLTDYLVDAATFALNTLLAAFTMNKLWSWFVESQLGVETTFRLWFGVAAISLIAFASCYRWMEGKRVDDEDFANYVDRENDKSESIGGSDRPSAWIRLALPVVFAVNCVVIMIVSRLIGVMIGAF